MLALQILRWTAARCVQPGCAVDPGSGLVNGALCNDCDLAAEDMEVVASGKASVKSKEQRVAGGGG
eukprot:39120-Chlamydomonas_euryale.AAC.2